MIQKIGLALGAGGAKGLAHIGVLQVLEREGIPLDIITGSSMGAAIGSFYAAGADLEVMAKLAGQLDNSYLIDLAIPKLGLIKGRKAHALIRLMTHNKNFSQMKVPLGIVATDLQSGQRVVFQEGNVADAVRASIAVPGVVEPFCLEGKMLVDGAVTDRVPAKLAKEMGADIVIAVDLQYFTKENPKINNIYDVIIHSIELLEKRVSNYYADYASIVIKPKVCDYSWTDFADAPQLIKIGQQACEEVIEDIRRVIVVKSEKVKK
ncbi:MAG: patatin-like phospholipase family protein [Bacillota bacterium]